MATKSTSMRNGHAKAVYSANGGAVSDGDVTLVVPAPSGHREMAIDVPPGYSGSGSQQQQQQRAAAPLGSQSAGASGGGATASASLVPPEKLKKLNEEVKKNKEEEARLQRQQEFLRNSLRESKKLQVLQQDPSTSSAAAKRQQQQQVALPQQPVNGNVYVNAAFSEEEDRAAAAQSGPLQLKGKGTTVSGAQAVTPLKGLGLDQYFTLLQVLRGKLGGANSNELRFLSQLFNNTKFQDAVGLHNHFRDIEASDAWPKPAVDDTAANDAHDLCEVLSKADASSKELTAILSQPAFRSLLLAHDTLAAVQVSPAAGAIGGLDDDEGVLQEKADEYRNSLVKVVRVSKSADPLGATVRNEGDAVVVGRIVKGGAADLSGFFHEGDELLEVNNVRIRGKNINEVSDMLANMTGQLVFIISPSNQSTPPPAERLQEGTMHVRALFDYDPEEDVYVPCQELGISFRKGDVLHVVSQIDTNWWQAYREGEEEQALAGLIPSKSFQEVMEGLRVRALTDARRAAERQKGPACCMSRRRKTSHPEDAGSEPEEILTYEGVERYYPQPNRKRPIVLIGPPDVGRKELREMLMQRGDGRYAAAIPHTSRQPKPEERDGKDYHFVPKHLFEADIHANKFVEHGLFEGHYYGTSLDAIRTVYMSGETCVLNLHPTSIKMLRDSGLMPYVVFVAPPNIERLKQNILQHAPPGKASNVTAAELKEIIDKGRDMESKYGHYIDFVVTTTDYKRALEDLLAEINRIEVEPQWVPSEWLRGTGQ